MSIIINAYDVDLSVDDDGHRTYDVVLHAVTGSKDVHAQQVYSAVYGLIPPYTPYVGILDGEIDARAFARRPKSAKRIDRKATRRKWEVILPFSTKPLKRCADHDFENPLDEPPKISGSFFRNQITADKDRNGVPLTNSSDEPQFTEIDDSRDTIIIEWNTDAVYLALRASLRDRVNDAMIFGLPRRTLKMSQWDWDQEFYGTCAPYYKNRIQLEVNIDEWNFERIDQGFRIKNGLDANGAQKYSKLMDDRDQPLNKPRLLDGGGGLLAVGAAPITLIDEVLKEGDFSQLLTIGLTDPLF